MTSRFLGFLGRQCFELRTIDNNLVNEPKSFTLNFQDGFTDNLIVIQPSSLRVIIVDNDGNVDNEQLVGSKCMSHNKKLHVCPQGWQMVSHADCSIDRSSRENEAEILDIRNC